MLRPHEKKVRAERSVLRFLSVVARRFGGELPVAEGRRFNVASEAASRTSMLRGVVRLLVFCDVLVAVLMRGLIEPTALLMLLRCVDESASSEVADILLPMLCCLHVLWHLEVWRVR
jgi:hypothetical protein